jgi:hypothetical protein
VRLPPIPIQWRLTSRFRNAFQEIDLPETSQQPNSGWCYDPSFVRVARDSLDGVAERSPDLQIPDHDITSDSRRP